MSIPRFFLTTLLLGTILFPCSRNVSALTDEEKRQSFLQSQQQGSRKEANPTPSPSSTPAKKKLKKTKAKPKPATKKKPVQKTPQETPRPTPTPQPEPPRPTVTPAPAPDARNAVIVEKSGAVEEEPTQESQKSRWWWPFGDSTHYKYLTPAVRRALDRAPVASHRWRYIVVHNSGTQQGNAKAFDYYHRHVRKMPNGLAYHFVIGNGTSSGNGAIEIGNRWTAQINGGHVHSDYLNNIALGICLVGDFNLTEPTRQQREALDELIQYLRKQVGKIDHKSAIVKPHRDINPPQWPTDCPGNRFPYDWLHSRFD